MLVAALRRFLALVGIATAVTLAGSAVLALLSGSPLRRALTLGLYLVGSALLIAGFFVGNRGRMRADSDTADGGPFALAGRRLRRATADEERESVSTSAICIALGVVLLVLAVAVDARHELV